MQRETNLITNIQTFTIMKLLTKEIESRLNKHPLYSQEEKGDDAQVIAKFFNPCGRGTWYVLEGERQENGDWYFFRDN